MITSFEKPEYDISRYCYRTQYRILYSIYDELNCFTIYFLVFICLISPNKRLLAGEIPWK